METFHDISFALASLDDTGSFTGIASGTAINRNQFAYTSDAFNDSLAEHKARGTMPAMLLHHDLRKPVGAWQDVTPSSAGLRVRGKLAVDTIDGRDAYAHLKAGSLAGLSTGARHNTDHQKRTNDGVLISKADLYEISLVSVPALPTARVLRVASIEGVRDLEDILREAGVSGRKAKAGATAAWRAINSTDEPEAALSNILDAASQRLSRFHRS